MGFVVVVPESVCTMNTWLCARFVVNGKAEASAGSPPRFDPNSDAIPPGATEPAKAAPSTRLPAGTDGAPSNAQYGMRSDVEPVWLATITKPSYTPVTPAGALKFTRTDTVCPGETVMVDEPGVTETRGSETTGATESLNVSDCVPTPFSVTDAEAVLPRLVRRPKLIETGSEVSVVASAAGIFKRPAPVCITPAGDPSCVAVIAAAVFTSALLMSCAVSAGRCCLRMAAAPATCGVA